MPPAHWAALGQGGQVDDSADPALVTQLPPRLETAPPPPRRGASGAGGSQVPPLHVVLGDDYLEAPVPELEPHRSLIHGGEDDRSCGTSRYARFLTTFTDR